MLVQEMFSGSAKKAVLSAGYPDIVSGPNRTMRPVGATRDHLPGKAKLKRGELGLRFVGSGIAIMSRFPIIDVVKQPYGRRSCPGLDCLSNKGVMLAKIALPGVPVPIEMYNTHMNSRKASKAPKPRHLAAHDRQALEASRFIGNVTDNASPLVFGGDFNMKHSEARWEQFSRYHALKLVHETCSQVPSPCDVRMSWEPWMDTQDLQFYADGTDVKIRPLRVEAMFDGGEGGPLLSDHDGFLVTYEISWPATLD